MTNRSIGPNLQLIAEVPNPGSTLLNQIRLLGMAGFAPQRLG
jgi:hypothetical protein